MTRKQRVIIGLLSSCVVLVFSVLGCLLLFYSAQSQPAPPRTPTPSPTPNPYHKGVSVTLDDPDSPIGKVDLWLVFGDCDVDVVYNYVPNGTRAILTGEICRGNPMGLTGETNFYRVRFVPSIMEDLQSDNLWVEEEYMSLAK